MAAKTAAIFDCVICARPVDESGVLECSHTLCSDCIIKLVEIRYGEYLIGCPVCNTSQSLGGPKTSTDKESAASTTQLNSVPVRVETDAVQHQNADEAPVEKANEEVVEVEIPVQTETPAENGVVVNTSELIEYIDEPGATRQTLEKHRFIQRQKQAFTELISKLLEQQITDISARIDQAITDLERARLVMITVAQRNAEKLLLEANRKSGFLGTFPNEFKTTSQSEPGNKTHATESKKTNSRKRKIAKVVLTNEVALAQQVENEAGKSSEPVWTPPQVDSLIDMHLLDDLVAASEAIRTFRHTINEFDDRAIDPSDPSRAEEKEILVCMGGSGESGYMANSEVFDPARGLWRPIAEMSSSRSFPAASTLKRRVIVTGGSDGENLLRSVEQYDASSNKWILMANMMDARAQHALVTCDGDLFAIGGRGAQDAPLVEVERYDAKENCWLPFKPLNFARYRLTAAVIPPMSTSSKSKIVVAGGHDGSTYLTSCEMFDFTTLEWRLIGSLKVPRAFAAMACCGRENVLFVFGGRDARGANLDTVEQLDVDNESWTLLDARMNIGRSRFAVASTQDQVFLVGGWSRLGRLASIESFDTVFTPRFDTVEAPMAAARSGHSLACVNLPAAAVMRLFSTTNNAPLLTQLSTQMSVSRSLSIPYPS